MLDRWHSMNSETIKLYLSSRSAQLFCLFVGIVLATRFFLNKSPLFIVALFCIPFIGRTVLKYPFVTTMGLYVFLVPFDSVLALGGGGGESATLTRFAGVAVIALLFAEGTLTNKLKRPDAAVYGLVFFVLLGVVSLTWALDPGLGTKRISTALGLLLLYLVLSSYTVTAKEYDLVCKIIVYSGVAATFYVLYTLLSSGSDLAEIGRLSLSFEERETDENQFAFSLLIPFALALKYIFSERRNGYKLLNAAMFILIAFAVMLSGSRGGLLGILAIFLVFFFGMRQSRKQRFVLLGMIALLALIFSLLPEMFWLRITGAADTGGAGRTDIWTVAIAAFKHYFLSGAGLNNFPLAFSEFVTLNPYQGNFRGSHNIYICIAVELGVLGIAFFAATVISHFRLLKSRSDYMSIALKASLAGILVSSFFLDVIWRKPFWLLWMLIIMQHNQNKQAAQAVASSSCTVDNKSTYGDV